MLLNLEGMNLDFGELLQFLGAKFFPNQSSVITKIVKMTVLETYNLP